MPEGEVSTFLHIWKQLSEQQDSSRSGKWAKLINNEKGSEQVLNARFELGRSDLYRRSSTFPLAAVDAPQIAPYQFTQSAGRKGILQAMQSSLQSKRVALMGKLRKAIIAVLQLIKIPKLAAHLNTLFSNDNDEVNQHVLRLLDPAITISLDDLKVPVFFKALDKVLGELTKILSHEPSLRAWMNDVAINGLELGNDVGELTPRTNPNNLIPLIGVQARVWDEHTYGLGLLNACMALGLCAIPLPERLLGPEIRPSPDKVSLPQSVESKWYAEDVKIDEVVIPERLEQDLPIDTSKWCKWTPLVKGPNPSEVTVASEFNDNINHRRALEMATSTVLKIASESLSNRQQLCALLLNLPHTINIAILGTQPTATVENWWAQVIGKANKTSSARQPPLLFKANTISVHATPGLRTAGATAAANTSDTPNTPNTDAATDAGGGNDDNDNDDDDNDDDAFKDAEERVFESRCSSFQIDAELTVDSPPPSLPYVAPKTKPLASKLARADLYPSDYSKNLVDSVLDLLHKLELNECEERAVEARLAEDEHTTAEPAEVEVNKRRKIVWDDATRTAAISGDRLYSFYRQLSGTAGESMNAVVQIDDSQYQRDLMRAREQATKLSTAASERFAGLIESTFAGLFRQSGLTFAIGNATQEVSIVSGNLRKQLTDLAQSEVGGLFQKSVELETLIESAKGKLTLTDLVRQLTAIGDVLQRSTYMAAYNPTSTLSIETVAQPSNSLVLNVRDVATAAVNIAYDNLERELKYHYHRMRVPILYELVEGPDAGLSNAFATLCAHVMVQQRLHAGAAAAYVTKWSASINARMLGVALKRAVDAVCVYVGKYHDPTTCVTRDDFFKPRYST